MVIGKLIFCIMTHRLTRTDHKCRTVQRMVPDSVHWNLDTLKNKKTKTLKYTHTLNRHTLIYLPSGIHIYIWGIVFVYTSTAYSLIHKTSLSAVKDQHRNDRQGLGKATEFPSQTFQVSHWCTQRRGSSGRGKKRQWRRESPQTIYKQKHSRIKRDMINDRIVIV